MALNLTTRAADPQRLGLVLLPGCSVLAVGAALDALAAANEALEASVHEAVLLSTDGLPVPPAFGPRLSVQHAAAQAPALQSIWIVGGADLPQPARDAAAAALLPWLRERAAQGVALGGIGTGAALLAQAGVLDGHRATLPWAHVAQMSAEHPGVVWSSNLYEIDRRRVCSAGGPATLDTFIAWLGQQHGDKLVQALLGHFGLERLRSADERQAAPLAARIGTASSKLAEAVALMEANLGEPLPTDDIARLVGISRRQMERLFKQHLDELPSRYYAELRLVRARRLLQQTSQSILQIGLSCGFASGSHFSNAYRARFGHTPRDERSQRVQAWRHAPNQTFEEAAP
jgi:transcriptional regulator GlxA family with amidase domain